MGLTREQAIELSETGFWETMSFRDRAMFQMFEERLCMPFDVFHEAVEKSLGRPVFTHEFGLAREDLEKELLGERAAPTFAEVLALIPAGKLIVVATSPSPTGTPQENESAK
jgi:hypothetical protein